MIGLIVILAGIASMFIGGAVTRSAVQSKLGGIDRDNMMAAQMRGVIPKWAPLAVLVGLVAVLVGIVLLIVI